MKLAADFPTYLWTVLAACGVVFGTMNLARAVGALKALQYFQEHPDEAEVNGVPTVQRDGPRYLVASRNVKTFAVLVGCHIAFLALGLYAIILPTFLPSLPPGFVPLPTPNGLRFFGDLLQIVLIAASAALDYLEIVSARAASRMDAALKAVPLTHVRNVPTTYVPVRAEEKEEQ